MAEVRKASGALQYNDAEKQNFKQYFLQPQKKGRPKKRKRGRPKKKKAIDLTNCAPSSKDTVDLTQHGKAVLGAHLEGAIETERREETKRVNWDDKEHAALRKRYAASWLNKNDMYRRGESYNLFCKRCAIPRSVLSRFMLLQKIGAQAPAACSKPVTKRGRGRPSLLPKDVMRHICEGAILITCA